MSALYRKYRPANFTEVIGQDHIRDNIQNSLKKGTIAHAYLFSGPRGTGKTTLARLMAKAINCQSPVGGVEPCGKCEVCVEMANGQSIDIIEIDAASNRGIEDIRELRDKIAYAPTRAKYRVYIIDEVHMLSKDAFNALLKTLEEPPAHAIFILATTELHKVPDTVISRCQRYQFHRASDDSLFELLKKVAKTEKIGLDDEAINVVVARAEGSFRDALTLLDNVSSQEKKLDASSLRELLGLPATEIILAVRSALENKEADLLIQTLRDFIERGGDLVVLVKAISDQLKQEILQGAAADVIGSANLLEQLLLLLSRVRSSADPMALLLAKLYDLSFDSKPNQLKIAAKAEEPKVITPELRAVSTVEQVAPAMMDIQKPNQTSAAEEQVNPVDAVTATAKPANADEFWRAFLHEIKEANHAIYAVVRSAELESLLEDKLIIAVKFRFYSERLYEARNKKVIQDAASKVSGREMAFECHVRADVQPFSEVKAEEDLVSAVVNVFEVKDAD